MSDHIRHETLFTSHRRLLFIVAYELLGSVADAEDVVQETWLRWSAVDLAVVRDPRAYLVRMVTRQALNRLRTLTRRREAYVGPWLPEPLLTEPDAAQPVELAHAVSTAMLVVLESLSPAERVVFVLREVFDVSYDELATLLDKSPAAVRQLAHRARSHVAARRPHTRSTPAQVASVTDRFLAAAVGGDLASLTELLAPEVTLFTDGGGVVKAALRPIVGRDKVLRFLLGVYQPGTEVALRAVNGDPGLLFGDPVDAVVTWRVDDDQMSQVFVQRNPEKLRHLHPDEPRR